jgi:RNA polymerase sigma-70 factor (ECF subfamily)
VNAFLASEEPDIRHACERGDWSGAAEHTLRRYGPEILGFMCARVGSEPDAREAFSDFSLDLWRGFERFEWRCSARVWAYALARHACARYLRRRRRLAEEAPLTDVAAPTPSRTPSFLLTPVRAGVDELRQHLAPDEREILVLRIDRQMSWPEVALVLAADDPGEQTREAARLRKRFQLIKDKLRKRAIRAGLLAARREGRC